MALSGRSAPAYSRLKPDGLLILALVVGLSLRVVLYVAVQPWDPAQVSSRIVIDDAAGYHAAAVSIARHSDFGGVTPLRTPGYPVFVAAFYAAFGDGRVWAPLLVQVLLDTAVIVLVYFLARDVTGSRRAGGLAALLYGASFISGFFATRLLTETLFTPLLAGGAWALMRAVRRADFRWIVASGALIGLATLVRPTAQYFALIVLVVTLLFLRANLRTKFLFVVAHAAVTFAVLTPWLAFNLHRYGHFELATIQGHNFYAFAAPIVRARAEGVTVEEARRDFLAEDVIDGHDGFTYAASEQRHALAYFRSHPLAFATATTEGAVRMLAGTGYDMVAVQLLRRPVAAPASKSGSVWDRMWEATAGGGAPGIMLAVRQLAEGVLVAIGTVLLYRRGQKLYVVMLVLIVAYFALGSGPVADLRYRVPLIPLYLIPAAACLEAVLAWITRKATARHAS